jgi:O-acetyl-ADP-ribose deacetylase (regulator of RNase III)
MAGVGLVAYIYYDVYSERFVETPSRRFLKKISVVPYGVLGTQMTLQNSLIQAGPAPDDSTVVLDPAGLNHIHGVASNAGGASGAIYNWLGLKGEFPEAVRKFISRACDAKLFDYNNHKVVHVVGPDFREGRWTEREAAIELSRAYRNALHEFVMSEGDTFRMAPISGGIFSGPLYSQMPPITQQALSMAFEQLHHFDREYVLKGNKKLELCVFMNREWDMYKTAFENLTASAKL